MKKYFLIAAAFWASQASYATPEIFITELYEQFSKSANWTNNQKAYEELKKGEAAPLPSFPEIYNIELPQKMLELVAAFGGPSSVLSSMIPVFKAAPKPEDNPEPPAQQKLDNVLDSERLLQKTVLTLSQRMRNLEDFVSSSFSPKPLLAGAENLNLNSFTYFESADQNIQNPAIQASLNRNREFLNYFKDFEVLGTLHLSSPIPAAKVSSVLKALDPKFSAKFSKLVLSNQIFSHYSKEDVEHLGESIQKAGLTEIEIRNCTDYGDTQEPSYLGLLLQKIGKTTPPLVGKPRSLTKLTLSGMDLRGNTKQNKGLFLGLSQVHLFNGTMDLSNNNLNFEEECHTELGQIFKTYMHASEYILDNNPIMDLKFLCQSLERRYDFLKNSNMDKMLPFRSLSIKGHRVTKPGAEEGSIASLKKLGNKLNFQVIDQ